ncbi:MAG: hypothetical protein M1839_001228 [Geoglossum umbratile]|nr:MAG: hypothetical protein M1839_001228 [Geoglossum umbratile]
MATLDPSQPRRKRATYGKPSHKRVQGYSYDGVFTTSRRSQEPVWDGKDALYGSNHKMASGRSQVVGSTVGDTESRVHRVGESQRSAAISMDQRQTAPPLEKLKTVERNRLQSPFDGRISELTSNTTSNIFDVPSSEDEIEAHRVTSKRTFTRVNHNPPILTASEHRSLPAFNLSDTTESNELESRPVPPTPKKRRKVVAPVPRQRSPVSLSKDDLSRKHTSQEAPDEYTAIPEMIPPPSEQKRPYKLVRSSDKTYSRQTPPPRAAPPRARGRQAGGSLPPEQRLESSARCRGDGRALERSKMDKSIPQRGKPLRAKETPLPGMLEYTVSARPSPEHISVTSRQVLNEIMLPDEGARVPALPIHSEKRSKAAPSVAAPGTVAPRQARRLNTLLAEGILAENEPNDSDPVNHGFLRYGRLDTEAPAPQAQTQDLFGNRPRKRLIDSLAVDVHDIVTEKASIDEDIVTDNPDPVDSQTQPSVIESHGPAGSQPLGDSQVSVRLSGTTVPVVTNAPLGNQRGGPKITYAQQRSFLTDAMLDETSLFDTPLDVEPGAHYPGGRRNASAGGPFPSQLKSLCQEQEAVDDMNGGAIRSIHELREAGGNKRFLDEMEALFEDIEDRSTNSLSRRRSSLLELGSKLAEKTFVRRFVENSFSQRLLVHLDAEHDVIVSTILASAVIFTMRDTVATHSALKIHQEGAAQMLLRLLDSDRDICLIAKERRTNMSKVAQSLVFDFRELMKDSSIWEVGSPCRISPRLIALRGLELIIRQLREEGATGLILPREKTEKIVQVLVPFSAWQSKMEPITTDRVELELALSILESCAINVGFVLDESVITAQSLDIVSRILPSIWRWTENNFRQIILLTLRLYLSITNNSPVICDAFAKLEMLNVLVHIVRSKFDCLSGYLNEEQRLYELDVLVLGLGLLINFAELSDIARLSILSNDSDSLLEALLRTFLERLEKAAEADSMEESQSNVAFGYLSVLLGSLCQNSDIRKLLRSKLPGGTLQPLAYAVDEFIQHHRKVDDLYDGESGSDSENGFTQRLQVVVDRLKQSEGLK